MSRRPALRELASAPSAGSPPRRASASTRLMAGVGVLVLAFGVRVEIRPLLERQQS